VGPIGTGTGGADSPFTHASGGGHAAWEASREIHRERRRTWNLNFHALRWLNYTCRVSESWPERPPGAGCIAQATVIGRINPQCGRDLPRLINPSTAASTMRLRIANDWAVEEEWTNFSRVFASLDIMRKGPHRDATTLKYRFSFIMNNQLS
jgi:hypothetical protein